MSQVLHTFKDGTFFFNDYLKSEKFSFQRMGVGEGELTDLSYPDPDPHPLSSFDFR
jgi:hypothetical protein